ncbi:MAG TPA: MBOAT family O-acyltransferase [Acidobacteriota bacterium]|nr:MBOAT family O-acyltransferase [Acidobacteriota bacterium]
MTGSILCTCTYLFVFKYLGFFATIINDVASAFHLQYNLAVLSIIIPIGLSFHTFQSMSYVIEVYRGRQSVQTHFGKYALYVLFYPQLVAGPIERPQHLMPQFEIEHTFEYARVMSGLRLILWGLFKKMVIADTLALTVDAFVPTMSTIYYFNSFLVVVGILFFAFQIYCDFSGYSDMAVGIGRVMGFSLTQNFNRPYFSKSISEFWRRWHISLCTWFRDYVYIPLGGNRVSKRRWIFNIFVVFAISGLWHGANWTFLLWGLLNGFFIVMEDMTRTYFRKKESFLWDIKGMLSTFLLSCVAWLFFRMPDLKSISKFFVLLLDPSQYSDAITLLVRDFPTFSLILVVVLLVVEYAQESGIVETWRVCKEKWFAFSAFLLLALSIYLFGVFDEKAFIYFQF